MIENWTIHEIVEQPKECIIALPGRGIPHKIMYSFCSELKLSIPTGLVTVQPYNYEWYPAPNGIDDQQEAINGLYQSNKEFTKLVTKVKRLYHLKDQNIILIGYSAGGVLTLYNTIFSNFNFKKAVVLAGALFEPNLPICTKTTEILLQHNKDDDCFKWDERFMPMYEELKNKSYKVLDHVKDFGGHNSFTWSNVYAVSEFLND